MQNVLDSVISALLEDKNRKFIYVEMVIVMMIIIVLSFGACINCDANFFLYIIGIFPEMVEAAK